MADKLKSFINKTKDFIKSIPKLIKRVISPIGQVIGWLLLIILIVILLAVIGKVATRAIARLVGINWNYSTFDEDLEVIKQLNASGYESTIDADNFQNFKSFEYAVLMDSAEFLRNTKQEMFDIGFNEEEYAFERSLLREKKPEQYNAKIEELSQKYANVTGEGSEYSSVSLMDVHHETDGRLLSDETLQYLIDKSANERNITAGGNIDSSGTIRGGTNRVNDLQLIYEFRSGDISGSVTTGNGATPISNLPSSLYYVDESKLHEKLLPIWQNYQNEIIYAAKMFGVDPNLIMAIIRKESSGILNSEKSTGLGLMRIDGSGNKVKNFQVTDLEGNVSYIDTTASGLKNNVLNQIIGGTAQLVNHHAARWNYNAYDVVGSYNKGNTGWKNAKAGKYPSSSNKSQAWFNRNYWSKIQERIINEDEVWFIKKEGDRYFVVYTSLATKQITRTVEVSADIAKGTASATNASGDQANTSTAKTNVTPISMDQLQDFTKMNVEEATGFSKVILIGDSRTVGMYSALGRGSEKGNLKKYDSYGYFWAADGGDNVKDMIRTHVPNMENEVDENTAIICLMGINGFKERNIIETYSNYLNEKAAEWKQKGAKTYYVTINPVGANYKYSNSEIEAYNNAMKNALSNDVGYLDTYSYLKGNVTLHSDGLHYQSETSIKIFNLINQLLRNENASSDGDTEEDVTSENTSKATNESGDGSLEPYIYITRENIEFSYYFDANNQVIEYPLLLNAYNAKLNVGTENSAEVNRALLGIAPVVFPDIDVSQYTYTPYYSNKSENTIYKIPLRVILGRYLPKAELLNAWSYIKQSVERDTEDTTEKGIMDFTIEAIKGVYNEACILGESNVSVESKKSGDEIIYYSNEESHDKTFVTFEKAGIESTKYDIDGLKGITGEDGDPNIKIVTDFISAVIIDAEDITVGYSVTSSISGTDETTGEVTATLQVSDETATISLSELSFSSRIKHGNYIPGSGTPEEGYSPPSSLEGIDGYYVPGTDDVDSVTGLVKSAITRYLGSENPGLSVSLTDFPEDVVKYNPIFITDSAPEVTQKLKIEHIRMPILLVKSAKTWCREVSYNHSITQNQFRQNNKKYIIPKSVSSIGLMKFETTVEYDGYRGRAYSEVFSKVQEKDVINMLMFLEMCANEGSNDSYEYMRDLYKLVKASQDYSVTREITNSKDPRFIHEHTYDYVYIPDSILRFDDSQSQKIYWLELLTATKDDPITKEELNQIRTKDKDITWQVVEYEKYEECNTSGSTKVYALSPFGSQYLRTYFETEYQKAEDVSGNFDPPKHDGADWSGRRRISDILDKGNSTTSTDNIGGKIFSYEIERLTNVYGEETAKAKLKEVLQEEKSNMPIVAIAPGRVEKIAYTARSGFYVKILHSEEEDVHSYYMHLKRWPLVNEGDYVGAGTLLGYEGCTGRSFGTHLHFQLTVGGETVSPEEYVFPTFNPFYNEEKAAGVEYDLTSDYMSLLRTVSMVGNDASSVTKVTNNVPRKPLVSNFDTLIQNQGLMEERAYSAEGELDWSTAKKEFHNVEAYLDYLEENKIYDIYLEEAFFDYDLAKAGGYLNFADLVGDIIVKTDLPGALPALTKSDLETILNGWLNDRYKDKSKVTWLMNNVFSDLDALIQAEERTKVSLVFAIAVATQEQNLGLSGTTIVREGNNIFSITSPNATTNYVIQNGRKWHKYSSFTDAFIDFTELISSRGPYFKDNRFTIDTIGQRYCPEDPWAVPIRNIVLKIMKYYPGNWSPPSAGYSGGSTEITQIARNNMSFYVNNNFAYSQAGGAGRLVPPYDENGNCRQKKVDGHYRTDCSTYVSWVIYEFAKAHGYTDLQAEYSKQHSSYDFQQLGSNLKSGSKSGIYQYFELVQYGIPGNNFKNIQSKLQAGDILVYREGNGHHVEIVAGEGTLVYTYGSTQTKIEPHASYTRRSDATCAIRLRIIN